MGLVRHLDLIEGTDGSSALLRSCVDPAHTTEAPAEIVFDYSPLTASIATPFGNFYEACRQFSGVSEQSFLDPFMIHGTPSKPY